MYGVLLIVYAVSEPHNHAPVLCHTQQSAIAGWVGMKVYRQVDERRVPCGTRGPHVWN